MNSSPAADEDVIRAVPGENVGDYLTDRSGSASLTCWSHLQLDLLAAPMQGVNAGVPGLSGRLLLDLEHTSSLFDDGCLKAVRHGPSDPIGECCAKSVLDKAVIFTAALYGLSERLLLTGSYRQDLSGPSIQLKVCDEPGTYEMYLRSDKLLCSVLDKAATNFQP